LVAKSLVAQETFKVKIIFTSTLYSASTTAISAQASGVSKPSVFTYTAENSE